MAETPADPGAALQAAIEDRERAAVVAWLRKQAYGYGDTNAGAVAYLTLIHAARKIAAGEHVAKTPADEAAREIVRLRTALADAVRAFRMAPPPDLRPIYDERGNLVRLLLTGEVVE